MQIVNTPGDAHFWTASCYRRMPLLSKDRSRMWFCDAVNAAREQHQFDVWAWVIMPEHVHLLICPCEPDYDMSDIVWSINQPVGVTAINWLKEHDPAYLEQLTVVNATRTYRRFWQAGPGFDENLDDPAALPNIIEYIHHNPVRRGLVERAIDWHWSSAREFAGLGIGPIPLDHTLPMTYE
ncbi:MAG: transposase [Planctomycetaceae bacterium]|nr:transposase [Planctomycetaceae bacterium]